MTSPISLRRLCADSVPLLALLVVLALSAVACSSSDDIRADDEGWGKEYERHNIVTKDDIDAKTINNLDELIGEYREMLRSPTESLNAISKRHTIKTLVEYYMTGLAECLTGGDDKQRYIAAISLGFLNYEPYVERMLPMLLGQLTSGDNRLRYYAMLGIALEQEALRNPDLVPEELRREIVHAMGSLLLHENRWLRIAAAEGLGWAVVPLADADVMGTLSRRLVEEEEADVRVWLVSSLRTIAETSSKGGDVAYSPILAHALIDDSADVRWEAVIALGASQDSAYLDALLHALDDEDAGVRKQGIAMLKRGYRSVPNESASASVKQRRARVVRAITEKLSDQDTGVREWAALSLGYFGDTLVVQPLIAKLGDRDKKVRIAAITSLGLLKDRRSVQPLIQALADRENDVRDRTIAALMYITGVNLGNTASDWQGWYDRGMPPVDSPVAEAPPSLIPDDFEIDDNTSRTQPNDGGPIPSDDTDE